MVKSPNLILTVMVRAPSSLPRRWDAAASTIRVKWPRMTSGSHKSDGNVSSWPIDFALWSGMTCRASSPRHNPARCEPCAFPRCRWSVAVGRDARSPTVRTILIGDDNVVLDGEVRLEAAKLLGLDRVPERRGFRAAGSK